MIIFEVYDRDGNLLVKGTSIECAKVLGLSRAQFWNIVNAVRIGRNKRYKIDEVGYTGRKDNRDRHDDEKTRQAIEAWDRFCEPLRKEFGIPVWKPESK